MAGSIDTVLQSRHESSPHAFGGYAFLSWCPSCVEPHWNKGCRPHFTARTTANLRISLDVMPHCLQHKVSTWNFPAHGLYIAPCLVHLYFLRTSNPLLLLGSPHAKTSCIGFCWNLRSLSIDALTVEVPANALSVRRLASNPAPQKQFPSHASLDPYWFSTRPLFRRDSTQQTRLVCASLRRPSM